MYCTLRKAGSQKVFVKQVIKHFLNANVPSQQFENIFKAFITDESQCALCGTTVGC